MRSDFEARVASERHTLSVASCDVGRKATLTYEQARVAGGSGAACEGGCEGLGGAEGTVRGAASRETGPPIRRHMGDDLRSATGDPVSSHGW